MKIIRSKGVSFTQEDNEQKIGRGLMEKSESSLRHRNYLNPENQRFDFPVIPEYIKSDWSLLLRQIIAVLDKIYPKVRKFSECTLQRYKERSELAEALWDEFSTLLEKTEGDRAKEIRPALKEKWLWKIHPYAPNEYVQKNRLLDKNWAILEQRGVEKSQAAPRTEWYKVFVVENKQVPEIAQHVLSHLLTGEQKINGEKRRENDQKGLSQARGEAIASSVSDPRSPKEKTQIMPSTYERYFRPGEDIAETILKALLNKLEEIANSANKDRSLQLAKVIGVILYDYFQPFMENMSSPKTDEQFNLWALHNKVRQYYAKLARGTRLKAIFVISKSYPLNADSYEARKNKLSEIVPKNVDVLKARLAGKAENSDLNELIRLGKLVAHACDKIPANAGKDEIKGIFESEMTRLTLSDGQSEIKRNESFTRIWRTSVAYSLRTLRQLVVSNGINFDKQGRVDISQMDIIKNVVTKFPEPRRDMKGLEIIFGAQSFEESELVIDAQSLKESEIVKRITRASIFKDCDGSGREFIWAFLRLAAEVRNKTNHFNTKAHLLSAVNEGFLTAKTEIDKLDNRQSVDVRSEDIECFTKLLEFDLKLRAEALVKDLNQIRFTHYVAEEARPEILSKLGSVYEVNAILAPSFGSLLKRLNGILNGAKNTIPEWCKLFDSLKYDEKEKDIQAEEVQEKKALHDFKVGMLRLLYSSDFIEWLDNRNKEWRKQEESGLRAVVSDVLQERKKRALAYAEEKKLYYADVHSILDDLVQNYNIVDLDDLMAELTSRTYSESELNRTYNPNKAMQSDRSSQIERFRRDLFLRLFATYIDESSLCEVINVTERNENARPLVAKAVKVNSALDNSQSDLFKGAQFYAWLYLVPPQQVAVLRNQFCKSRILENKSVLENRDVEQLKLLERLMSLYVHVQPIGFNGEEHIAVFKNESQVLYENINDFDQVFSQAFEDSKITLDKTRRGLRQLIRFGIAPSLHKIFEKHAISTQDVQLLGSLRENAHSLTETKLTQLAKIRQWREKQIKEKKEKKKKPVYTAEAYEKLMSSSKQAIWAAQKHKFMVEKIRLNENLRLHDLYMRIISRLMDFTALWEKDMHFVLLGYLYRQIGQEAFELTLQGEGKMQRLCVKLPEEIQNRVKGVKRGNLRGNALNNRDKENYEEGLFEIWTEDQGISLTRSAAFFCVLPQDDETQFRWKRFFHEVDFKNIEYKKNEELRKAPKNKTKAQIRNDFAHFNVIDGNVIDGENVGKTLTYQVNAVRSLMSYDRKLKNAVVKAISDILTDAGVVVEWQMKADRLRFPEVYPMSSQPLGRARGIDKKFSIPQVSFRFCSMVKGLFDFSGSGYMSSFSSKENNPQYEKYKNALHMRYPAQHCRINEDGREKDDTIEMQHELLGDYLNLP